MGAGFIVRILFGEKYVLSLKKKTLKTFVAIHETRYYHEHSVKKKQLGNDKGELGMVKKGETDKGKCIGNQFGKHEN